MSSAATAHCCNKRVWATASPKSDVHSKNKTFSTYIWLTIYKIKALCPAYYPFVVHNNWRLAHCSLTIWGIFKPRSCCPRRRRDRNICTENLKKWHRAQESLRLQVQSCVPALWSSTQFLPIQRERLLFTPIVKGNMKMFLQSEATKPSVWLVKVNYFTGR